MQDGMAEHHATDHAGSPGRRRFGWVAAPLVIFAGLALMFTYALKTGDPSRLPSALIGKPVPQFALEPIAGLVDDGRPVPGIGTADLARGRVSVVNFWASWCVPCVQEHPVLLELTRRTGVDLYGINYKDKAAAARRFLGHYGNPYRAVGADGNGRTAIEWGVYGMPETFVVDGRGRIAYKHVGPISLEALETKVIPAIEAARAAASG
ncbi:MAG: DsbE family thiol:disulfide interchange protein [Hyphomicrobiaceae bacterium]|nr:DsbE family thiol:disulfide interchange protein [Hyphomicrobiaceae bacterium]